MTDPRDNARGILAMNGAMFAFIVNDSFVKAATASLPIGQIMFVRGVVATVLILALCRIRGDLASVHRLKHPMIALRIIGEIGATVFYLSGLVRLPIGNATAIFQVTPLAVTAAAAIFLGERVGWRRWTAIAIGFAGVLLIIRPGLDGFNSAAFFILASVAFVVLRDLSTARMPAEIPTFVAAASSSIVITLCGLLIAPFDGLISRVPDWQPLDWRLFGMLAGAGVFLLMGYVLQTTAMRTGEMSVIAPFRYSLLLWSFLIGIFVFAERPDGPTLVGTAIIVATGVYTFHRERKVRAGIKSGETAP